MSETESVMSGKAIEAALLEPSPEFSAWAASIDPKHWAKRDISACRLGWEAGRAHIATELLALRKRVVELEGALENVRSFVAVMHGRGPDAIIPETIPTPLGIPVKIGSIMRRVDAALLTPKEPS